MSTSLDLGRIPPLLRAAVVLGALAVGTVVVAVLDGVVGVPEGSSAYLLAVVGVAITLGTRAAVATAVGAFLAYDLLLIEPRLNLTVSDPGEWLNLVLLLVVGIVVGQLTGMQRARADDAAQREREARALFSVSRALATAVAAADALPAVVDLVRTEASMDRIWIRSGEDGLGRVMADSGTGPVPTSGTQVVLRRTPGDAPAVWTRVHPAGRPTRSGPSEGQPYRIRITADGTEVGSVWGTRARRAGDPSRPETRLLSAAADQVGAALQRDRLRTRALDAEVVRRSDALKTALLDSVSHDLRTPLASIRVAAGTLMDRDVSWTAEEALATAGAIDREAERLDRLVSHLLDMSRIESGDLRPTLRPHDLPELVDQTLARLTPVLATRTVHAALPGELPAVLVDDVYVDQVLGNVLENAARYVPAGGSIWVAASTDGQRVGLTIEDDGPGVPEASLPHLFEKFYRVPRSGEGSRRGTGIGLAVVRGLVEAMGGTVDAARSARGGLAIRVTFRVAPPEADADAA